MDRWSQLSMSEKSDLMSLYIRNGISSLEEIKKHYNSFATGGHLYQDGGSDEPNFVGGATALKKDYNYELEHLADKYAVTAEGPWHDYGIHNPSPSQRDHWNELSKMYNRVAQRPDYEYLNPTNILEYTPIVGDAMDMGNSIYDLQQGNVGVGLAELGMLALPNAIEKPLKAIGKPIINTLDNIRYYKYKKNAPHIANKAYTDHLSRVGLTLEDVPMITSGHEEDLVKEHIKQAGYNIENIEDRVRFLRDQGYISGNISKQKVDDYILHLLRSGKYNANSTPAHYSTTDLGSSFIAVGDDAGRTISDIVNESDLSYPATLGKNIILNNGKVSYDFPWYNLNNQSIKSHELTHYLQYKHNLKHNPLYHSLIDYDKIKTFPKKWEDELMKNNATEVDARLSQILDFYDISDDKNIKPSQIRYIRNNYRGSDNNMRMLFESLIDDNKKIADYINDASHRKYLKYGGKVKDDIKNKELIIKDNFIEKSLEDFLK